jgi:choline dehydrogenase-like flavoprotein
MITDICTIPSETSIDSDVCIIGGGAAGIAIARELSPTNLEIVVLESGGYRREESVQDLYSGLSVGEKYYKELDECRSRYLGGSTNCWSAIFTPLNEIDFEKRSWVPWSGWPLRYDEIRPWLQRAHYDYGAGPFLYGKTAWEAAKIPEENFDLEKFEFFVWHFNDRIGALSFAKRFRQELRAAPNVLIVLHANVTEILTRENGCSVDRVRVKTLDGSERYVRSKIFVLACGGIENPRLLLASTSTRKDGLGNDRDLVGRFFLEHLHMPVGYLVGARPAAARYSRLSRFDGTCYLPGLVLTPSAQRAHRTLNGSVSVEPVYDREGALIAFRKIRESLKERRIAPDTMKNLWKLCCDAHKLAPGAWRRLVLGDRPKGENGKLMIYARAEQSPNPESRVMLGDDVDALGMRRACLDWRTSDLDRKAIHLLTRFVKTEFARLGLGQVVENPWPEGGGWPESMAEGPHHMGTTRMSDDPSTGVVDRNCKVHGLDGLYIAGSSIFPTGGHANPTMSILAFAIRLASHVRETLQGRASAGKSSTVEAGHLQESFQSSAAAAGIAAVSPRIDPDTRSIPPARLN